MNHATRQTVDSSFDSRYEFISGGDRFDEVSKFLSDDFEDEGRPAHHNFHKKDKIIRSFSQGLGVYIKGKECQRILGYVTYTYNTILRPPNLELDHIHVGKQFRRRGMAKLMLKYIHLKLLRNVSIFTGSPTHESIPVFLKWSLCQLQHGGIGGDKERIFISTRPYSVPLERCPNEFSLRIDTDEYYYPIKPIPVMDKEDFTLFKMKPNQEFRNVYTLDAPVIFPQDSGRDYQNNPITINLWHNNIHVATKKCKDSYSCDRYNDENVIFIAGTCIWIAYLYGELGACVTKILSKSNNQALKCNIQQNK